jgi:hypothetical protein
MQKSGARAFKQKELKAKTNSPLLDVNCGDCQAGNPSNGPRPPGSSEMFVSCVKQDGFAGWAN